MRAFKDLEIRSLKTDLSGKKYWNWSQGESRIYESGIQEFNRVSA